jgi:hypothetical protein
MTEVYPETAAARHNPAVRRLQRVRYLPASRFNPEIPAWIDKAPERAVALTSNRRYALLSELVHDLSHPNPAFTRNTAEPLIERNPQCRATTGCLNRQ